MAMSVLPTDMWNHINTLETIHPAQQAQQAQQALIHEMVEANRLAGISASLQSKLVPALRARNLFFARMGAIRTEWTLHPDDHITCHVINNTVILFWCCDGKHGSVEENIDLFPSDQLIAQFRFIFPNPLG
jgi:hypothetical protein